MSANPARRTFWEALGQPQSIVSWFVLYCAMHFLVRVLLSPNLNAGEADPVLFGQSFQWGYRPGHPPLMVWLSWAVLSLTQGSRFALFLLREAIVCVGLSAIYGAARLVLADVRHAAYAAFLLTAMYGFGWLLHDGRLETALLAAMLALYLWADLRTLARGSLFDHVVLGLVTGLGVLTSYIFLVLPFALSVGVALTPELRRRLRLGPLAIAAAVAVAIVAPYFAFAPAPLAASTSEHGGLSALRDVAIALVLFSLPGVAIFAAVYPRACLPLPREDREQMWLRLLKIAMLSALIVSAAAILLLKPQAGKIDWVYPVLLPLPLYLLQRAALASAEDRRRERLFLAAIAVCVVAVLGGRYVAYRLGAGNCKQCSEYWPMARYADSFRQAGFLSGTIAASDVPLAGNLRSAFPEARVVTPHVPAKIFGPPVVGECLVVWPGTGPVPSDLADYVKQTYGANLQQRALQGDIEAALVTGKGGLARMNFLILAQGACDKPRT
jgi:hypothetical protein